MENDLILEIDNVGPISHAKIDIGKINIIGGKNSTGKSTSSKLLYCFLRSNSNSNEDLIVSAIIPRLSRFGYELSKFRIVQSSLIKSMMELRNLSLDEIIEYYEELKLFYFEYEDEAEDKLPREWRETPIEKIEFEKNFPKNLDQDYIRSGSGIKERKNSFEHGSSKTAAQQYLRNIYRFEKHIKIIDEMIHVEQNPNKLFQYLMRGLIFDEFDLKGPNFSQFGDKISFSSKDFNICWKIDFNKSIYEKNGIFNIENIFYLDSFSIFDLSHFHNNRRPPRTHGNDRTDHVQKLSENITDETEAEFLFDDIDNKEIIEIEEKIKNIIGGCLEIEDGQFIYKTTENSRHTMVNTASGIKQIGVIQKLLSNRKLKSESFLIIDEPEVNLHPEWQVKFAEILVLLASELDINIYINTHSPMFIEAMSLYSEYYGLLDETYVYLSKEDKDYVPKEEVNFIYVDEAGERKKLTTIDNNPKFTFEKIDPKDMGAVYENLSKPYDDLDKLKSEILFKEE